VRAVRALLVSALLAAGAVSCDPSHGFTFVNTTDQDLVLRGEPTGSSEVKAGSTRRDTWIVGEGQNVRVEARNALGEVVFCRRFTFDELERASWRVEITASNTCR
jgi:hypothetical protein